MEVERGRRGAGAGEGAGGRGAGGATWARLGWREIARVGTASAAGNEERGDTRGTEARRRGGGGGRGAGGPGARAGRGGVQHTQLGAFRARGATCADAGRAVRERRTLEAGGRASGPRERAGARSCHGQPDAARAQPSPGPGPPGPRPPRDLGGV